MRSGDKVSTFATLVWTLIIVALLPWRYGVYYTGGVDPVVAAKGLLTLLAAALAWLAWSVTPTRSSIGVRSPLLVACFVAISLVGAAAADTLLASSVVAVRVFLLGTVVVLLVSTYGPLGTIRSVRNGLMWASIPLSLTGLGTFASTGRLGRGVLPINPNEWATTLGVALLITVWGMLVGVRFKWAAPTVVLLMTLVAMTGSRTGLLAILAALVPMLMLVRRRPVGTYVLLAFMLPLAVWFLGATGIVAEYFGRGGGSNVGTLNSRTIAWQSAFGAPYEFWRFWFGSGLSVREIRVSGAYWDAQVLDSSWVSAFVQAGALGVIMMAAWVTLTLISASSRLGPWRPLTVGLTLYLATWSITATGLIDAYILHMLMLTCAVIADPATTGRDQVDPGARPSAIRVPTAGGPGVQGH